MCACAHVRKCVVRGSQGDGVTKHSENCVLTGQACVNSTNKCTKALAKAVTPLCHTQSTALKERNLSRLKNFPGWLDVWESSQQGPCEPPRSMCPPQGYRSSFLGTVLSLLILSVRPEPYTLSVFLHSFPRGTASWILRHQEQVKFSKKVAAGIFFCVVGRWFILLRQKFPISSQIILKNKTVG